MVAVGKWAGLTFVSLVQVRFLGRKVAELFCHSCPAMLPALLASYNFTPGSPTAFQPALQQRCSPLQTSTACKKAAFEVNIPFKQMLWGCLKSRHSLRRQISKKAKHSVGDSAKGSRDAGAVLTHGEAGQDAGAAAHRVGEECAHWCHF